MQNIQKRPIEGYRVLRIQELVHILGLSRSTLYAKFTPGSPSRDISFPRPLQLGGEGGRIGFIESEIIDWIDLKRAERDVDVPSC